MSSAFSPAPPRWTRTSPNWSKTLDNKSRELGRWSKRRRSISDGSTGRWPTPSTAAGGEPDHDSTRNSASFWRSVGYLTSLGWMIALPIGCGVLLGRLLDDRLG